MKRHVIASGTIALLLAACGGDAGTTTTAATPGTVVQSTESTQAAQPTTTTTPASGSADTSTTTADPFAIYQPTEPFEITVEWTCADLLDRGGGSYASSCSINRADHPILNQTNWNTAISYVTDDNGDRVGITVATNSYGPACMWNNDAGLVEVDLLDGVATYGGLLIGDGRCVGIQWEFETTWDDESQTHVTTGVIGPIP